QTETAKKAFLTYFFGQLGRAISWINLYKFLLCFTFFSESSAYHHRLHSETPQTPSAVTAMVRSATLSVFLLCSLSLCLRGTEAQDVDQNTLLHIIRLIEQYSPGPNKQYAMAINIPPEKCGAGFQPNDTFLAGDNPAEVKCHFSKREIYQSATMIGAVPKENYHSEFWLLNPKNPDGSPMKNLLNKRKDGCVIFYTYKSPCLGTCLNATNTGRNILTALDMFTHHDGPKAFVYSQIFGTADAEKYRDNFAKVNAKIQLYRCANEAGCHACFNGGTFNQLFCLNNVNP
ncbi:hypothetical protein SRHO_G00210890, partial [Serrasalmus rhombeus]